MKKSLIVVSLLSFALQLSHAQQTSDWLREDAILDIFHVIKGPYSEQEDINAFLNEEYMPIMEEAYPGTFSFHIEGIAGDRKGEHAKFWIFPSVAIRDSYFPKAGGSPTEKYTVNSRKLIGKISENKTIELFRGWDFDFKTDWRIVGMTDGNQALAELRGLEMDVHYLHKKQRKGVEKQDPFITSALAIMEEQYGDEDFGIKELGEALHLSRMQVHRKLKALTNYSTSQFINYFRLEKGKVLLEDKSLNISEVSYSCGFSDPGYFSKLFSKKYGLSPLAFKGKKITS